MSRYPLVIVREPKLVWPVLALTAFLTLTAPQVTWTQDDSQQQWCEKACRAAVATASAPPPVCDCTAFVTGGGGSAPDPESGGGDRTFDDVLDEMVAAHEAEMAQVQNYLLIEKKKAVPLPNIRYFEKKPGGEDDFVWIPNHELARRETARNPSNNRTGNQRIEVPPEMVEDPTVFIDGLGDAAKILATAAGSEVLGRAAEAAIDAESADIRETLNEDGSREGIEGAGPLGGLLNEHDFDVLYYFGRRNVTDVSYGSYAPGTDTYERLRIPGAGEPVPTTIDEVPTLSGLPLPVAVQIIGDIFYDDRDLGDWPSSSYPCLIAVVDSAKSTGPLREPTFLPTGSKLLFGELWTCKIPGQTKTVPIRLSLTYLDSSLSRIIVEEENKDFVRRGPALLPRKLVNRLSRAGQPFINALEREVRVNLAEEPTQTEIATITGEAMDWDSFYNQSSP